MLQSTQEDRIRHAGAHIHPTIKEGDLAVDIGGVCVDQRHMKGLQVEETNGMPPRHAPTPSDEHSSIILDFSTPNFDAFTFNPREDTITVETKLFEYESAMVESDIAVEMSRGEQPRTDVRLECFDFEVRDRDGKTIAGSRL